MGAARPRRELTSHHLQFLANDGRRKFLRYDLVELVTSGQYCVKELVYREFLFEGEMWRREFAKRIYRKPIDRVRNLYQAAPSLGHHSLVINYFQWLLR